MRIAFVGVLIALTIGVAIGSGQAPAAPAAQSAAEPWPDAAALAERRQSAERRPLFVQAEPLEFSLVADFRAVQRDRDPASTKTYPATLIVKRADGTDASIAMKIRTRGHSRRRPTTCTFAPLRLEFAGDTAGTPFEGQRNLKLGTHCRDVKEYEEYILREYGVYRMFNLLTPRSFRARIGKATYVDANSKRPIGVRSALFLEDDDDVARRLEGRNAELRVLFRRVDQETLTLLTLFHYMIGNTDMSLLALHNIVLVRTKEDVLYPVPYDFDYAGVVNARYAMPDKQFGLVSVRERLYRGPCRTAEELEPFFARMRAVKDESMAVWDTIPGLDPDYVRSAKSYLDQFYTQIDRPRDVRRAFIERCGNRAGM
jgi:hypothetical protein